MTLAEFRRIRARIQPYIRNTPTVPCGLEGVWLKLETLQPTHSFKLRGAFARVADLADRSDNRTILAVSAGNHGLAVARAASTFSRPCVVIVPESAPRAKVAAIESYGVDLRVRGRNYDEAEALALDMARDEATYAFVSPYNDRHVVLGQGSLAFEILEQVPTVDTVLVSVGGGGLLAGVAAVIKQMRKDIRVIGVQAEASAAMYESLRAGRMVTIPDRPSIADGIQGNIDLATITFPIIQQYADEIVVVSEGAILKAMQHLLYKEKLLTEGSAAATFAAVADGTVKRGIATICVLSGGNVDLKEAFGLAVQ
jgi:threonine dehydratase